MTFGDLVKCPRALIAFAESLAPAGGPRVVMTLDRIEEINGFKLTNPENALQAYARLRFADQRAIEILRRGQSKTIRLTLR